MPTKEIQTYNNQRIIKVNKGPCDKNYLYTQFNLQALDDAMEKLTSQAGIKLWLYIGKNANSWEFALSSKDFQEKANCGEKAYRTAFEELVECGYLVPKGTPNEKTGRYTHYDFNEWGKTNILPNVRQKKQAVVVDDGKFHF